MRPSSLTSPGALLRHRIGPASPDQGTDTPASLDCCATVDDDAPDRAAERTPFSLGETTGDTEDLNESEGTVTDGGGELTFANPGNANDGTSSAATIGSYASGSPPDDGYLVSELVASRTVSSMLITADSECQATYPDWVVYSSDDGVSWDVVPFSYTYTHFGASPPDQHLLVFDDPVDAKWWRIRWRRAISGFTCGVTINTWAINGATTVGTAWSVLEPLVVDGDDATSEDTAGPEHLRFDLGAAFRIMRTRIRLGTTSAGSKTLTLTGWNELDESDAVVVTTIPFTATGSLTAQDVEASWYTDDSYRYWQLDGPSEIVRWFSVEFYEPTLATNHQHDVDTLSTTETDAGLVLHPDGAGGVEWGPDEGGGVTDHGALTGLSDDDHPQYATNVEFDDHSARHESGGADALTGYVTVTDGGGEVLSTIAASGAAETIDLANGNVHDITLTADCTFTFTSPAAGRARSFTLFLRENGTGGHANDTVWPGSVVWAGGSAPTLDDAASAVNVITFVTLDGGAIWYGFPVGGGSSVVDLDDLGDVDAPSPADGDVLTWDSGASEWIAAAPTPGSGGEDTSFVEVDPSGSTETIDCSDARLYRLVLDDDCTVTLTGAVDDEAHRLTVLVVQDGTGGWTVTWPAEVYWPGGVTPTLATDPGHTDWIDLVTVDGGATWLGALNAADYETDPPAPPGGGGKHWPMLALSSA